MTTTTAGIVAAPGRGEPSATIMAPAPLAVALGRIAQAVSGALELKDVFTGVAEAAATVLPFDIMAVGRLEALDTWTVYAIFGHTEDLPRTLRTEDVSPAIRVAPEIGRAHV